MRRLWSEGDGADGHYPLADIGLLVIPVHIFYLKYFEEYELELRWGESYAAYRREVSFLMPGRSSRRRSE
jgi:protein-S-isoprenylcysteine O-methyltransferase Ste14